MLEFKFEDTINAPVEVVFNLMSDLQNCDSWNPFVTVESGTAKLGEVVVGKAKLGKMTIPYRHRIYEYIPGKSLCWRDFGLLSLLVCGDRSRFTESVDGVTHFTCHLKVSGPFSVFANLMIGKNLRNGIIAEARALKMEAEKCSSLP